MVEPEIIAEGRKKLAETSHKNFVDTIWPKFGLTSHPGYCLVQIVPLFSLGGFSYGPPESVFLNDLLNTMPKIRNEALHETAHFLDPFTRNLHETGVEPTSGDELLHETLANLATMVFLDLSEGGKTAKAYPFYLGKPTYSGLLALDLFEADKNLLSKLAPLNLRKARKIIMPHLRRQLNTRKSPYDED